MGEQKQQIPMLSIGLPSTLASYRHLSKVFFGEDSEATKYILSLIEESGEDEVVIADEGQMLYLLATMHNKPSNTNQ